MIFFISSMFFFFFLIFFLFFFRAIMTCVQWCIIGLFSPSLDNCCLNLSIGGQPILGHCICWLQLELWILQILKKILFLFLVAFLHKRLKWSQDHLAVFLSAVQFKQEGTFCSVECLQSVLCVGTNTHTHTNSVSVGARITKWWQNGTVDLFVQRVKRSAFCELLHSLCVSVCPLLIPLTE